jgi:hypothetical protein
MRTTFLGCLILLTAMMGVTPGFARAQLTPSLRGDPLAVAIEWAAKSVGSSIIALDSARIRSYQHSNDKATARSISSSRVREFAQSLGTAVSTKEALVSCSAQNTRFRNCELSAVDVLIYGDLTSHTAEQASVRITLMLETALIGGGTALTHRYFIVQMVSSTDGWRISKIVDGGIT